MEFGVFLLLQSPSGRPYQEIYPRAVEIAQLADELGFSKFWVAEHHFTNYSYSSRPLMLLTDLASRTKRIRIGPAIIPLPLHHPLVVAEELATLDQLSGGRLEIGIGKGYQKYQFDRLGLNMADAPIRYDEGLDVLNAALKGEDFSYNGNYYRIPTTRIFPQPLQERLPLWLVVNTTQRQTIEDALRRGAHMFTGGLEPLSKLTNPKSVYPDLFETAGMACKIGTQRQVFVTQNASEAERAAEEARWHARVSVSLRTQHERIDNGIALAPRLPSEPSTDVILDEFLVAGTPDQCISQLRRIEVGLGADSFNCSIWAGEMPQDMILRSLELFAREVMPAFQ